MATLALGALLAVNATVLLGDGGLLGIVVAIAAFSMIGAGVGAAGHVAARAARIGRGA